MARELLPVWDLSDLYSSPKDKRLLGDLDSAARRARAFKAKYHGKLAVVASRPRDFRTALEAFESIVELAAKPLDYASLRFSECATDAARGALLQNCRERYLELQRDLTFFELEILSLSAATLKRATKAPELERFRNFLVKLAASKPHRLSEREEQILQEKRATGGDAFARLFDEEFAAKKYRTGKGRGEKVMSEAEILYLIRHPKRSVRKEAAQGFTRGLEEESRRLTFIFNTLVQDKSTDDRFTKFPNPEAARHLSNQISREAVDSMVSAVMSSTGIVSRYYRLKGKLLGISKLTDYDRYAPLPSRSESEISFAEARKIIIEASERFSPEYAEMADLFFRKRWIHAAPVEGKRSGAFCSFVTADVHPYILVNYTGTLREVLTLAHELGHGIHAYLMRKRGYINFNVPLTIAETASVFGEMTVFNYLQSRVTDPRERLKLYCAKLEEMFATVFRQVVMHRFEQSIHAARKNGELSTEQLNQLWMKHQNEMFNGSVELTPGYRYWWGYISHFIHSPFYVYAYAFGELLTVALYAQYQKALDTGKEKRFVEQYLGMLTLGDSAPPAELVRPFGISLEKKEFWMGGLSIIGSMLSTVEKLAKSW